MGLGIDPQIGVSQLQDNQHGQEQLKQTCQQFEAFFLQKMFQSMRQAVPEGGLIERSNGQKWFEEAFDAEVAQSISTGKSTGLADTLYEQMSKGPTSSGEPGEGFSGSY
ncbi:MAG: rod-binding protein [Thermodesulfobacteriota bacterium]